MEQREQRSRLANFASRYVERNEKRELEKRKEMNSFHKLVNPGKSFILFNFCHVNFCHVKSDES